MMSLFHSVATAIFISAAALSTPDDSKPAAPAPGGAKTIAPSEQSKPGMVQCANLIYGNNKTSVCYSAKFLEKLEQETTIVTSHSFSPTRLDSAELFQFPYAVMSGEGDFTLSQTERDNLRHYLLNGGFIVASAGCSSAQWSASFRKEIKNVFPDVELTDIPLSHPIFHSVYDIDRLDTSHNKTARLQGLEIDGKIVLVFSSDGLNDTANAGGKCCCCGGDEIRNAQKININIIAYALTH